MCKEGEMKKFELAAIVVLFIVIAILTTLLYQAFANYLVTKDYCEHTPMNKMTDKQWSDCLELLK